MTLRTVEQVRALLVGYRVDVPVGWVTDIYPEEPVSAEDAARSHQYGAIVTVP